MHAIVSLLDNDHHYLIEDLWAELKREFSVHGVDPAATRGAHTRAYGGV